MSAVSDLRKLMEDLRRPETGCPWDREQRFETIAPYTLEEAYEVVDAIERQDLDGLREELGDLLLQVVFHSRIAEEQGAFDLEDVARGIVAKMTRRHPHVFGPAAGVTDSTAVREAWERQKQQEREARGSGGSLLDGVTRALPAVQRAAELQGRATRIGFDWPDARSVLAKLDEERDELAAALAEGDLEAAREELADVLFVATHLARHLETDAEMLLRGACNKFERRFRHIEASAAAAGVPLDEAGLERLEAWWQAAKQSGL